MLRFFTWPRTCADCVHPLGCYLYCVAPLFTLIESVCIELLIVLIHCIVWADELQPKGMLMLL